MSLKICTIGCGNHSSLVHGPSYLKYVKNYPDTVLEACCDLDNVRATAYREKFGFLRSYTDMYEMLEKEKPDAVCVIVPEPLICDTATAVMNLGYHILLEKPPGMCKKDTQRMIAEAESRHVINHVAFNRRYIPLVKKLKEELQEYAVDGIQNILYEFYRYERREGTFETTAIHGIDAVKNIAGSNYKQVRFTYQEMPQYGPKVANIYLECTFENGVIARINFVPCAGVVVDRACINAKDHTFFLQTPIWNGFDTPGELVHVHNGELVSKISGLDLNCGTEMFETNGFYDENEVFFENVRAGKQGTDTISSALQAVEIAEAIKLRRTVWNAE